MQVDPWYHDDAPLLLLKDKVSGDLKAVPVRWDPERMTKTGHRLERINAIVRELQDARLDDIQQDQVARLIPCLPPVIDAPEVCRGCPFFHVCASELATPGESVDILDDSWLNDLLDIREKHRVAREVFEQADGDAKAILRRLRITLDSRGKSHLLCGDHLITVSEVKPKGKAPYFTYDFWKRPEKPES